MFLGLVFRVWYSGLETLWGLGFRVTVFLDLSSG